MGWRRPGWRFRVAVLRGSLVDRVGLMLVAQPGAGIAAILVNAVTIAPAVARTKRAVRVRFGAPPHQHEVWVWAGAGQRT